MLSLAFATPLAVALSIGSAQLTIDGETTTHTITDCAIEAEGAMPARLLIEDLDLTLNLAQADHMQTISVIRDNRNWTATRLKIGDNWMDQGKPSDPFILDWGETIHVEAMLTSGQSEDEKAMKLIAKCG
ncbi:hypothetical protein K1X12_14735 [Hyphomonas sp. WL0036]|uniref:hypothetical protein n=1 Tax=Hyphomonas sediminis TaxID=2866160 RepID=UPI001C8160A5|nr:hypothetical protein [Hyphomonas sediminis]MBY9068165.1 hypothetical protein [Hyphomonas sediminis]